MREYFFPRRRQAGRESNVVGHSEPTRTGILPQKTPLAPAMISRIRARPLYARVFARGPPRGLRK